ncbi:MAG: hypothetical protein JSS54_11895 [Proteobacteria bacterium]|nr:hypothetical protein [Pseudomonadota bacterium]
MTFASPVAEDAASLFQRAEIFHAARQWDKAEDLCRRALDRDATHAHALKMLVLILLAKADEVEAERILVWHLGFRPDHGASHQALGQLKARRGDNEGAVVHFECAAKSLPTHAPLFNDLGVSLHRLGRREEAFAALSRAVELNPDFGLAHENLGVVLFDEARFDAALQAQLMALINTAPTAIEARTSILGNLVKAAWKSGRPGLAEQVVRVEVESNYSAGAAEQLAVVLEHLRRPEEAKMVRNEVARRTGARWFGATRSKAMMLIIGAVGGNHIPTRYLIDSHTFSSCSINLLSPDQPDAPFGAIDIEVLRRADVIFNVLGDADQDDGQLAAVSTICESLGKPVLNPPDAILKTGRNQAVELFGDIDGMITPAACRASRAELSELSLDEPLLVRPTGDHGGDRLVLLNNDLEKDAYLAANSDDRLVLTPFYNFQSPDGYWRKYRLIFIDREVYPYHLAIGEKWLVHYWRAEMARADWKKQEEERFLANWRLVFGDLAASAVEEAARRLDLDYCGMDCALTGDGRILLFEANACMLIHLDEPAAAFPYKHRYVPIIRDAFSHLVLDRVRMSHEPPLYCKTSINPT